MELDKTAVDSYVRLMRLIPDNERDNVVHAMEVMLKAMQDLRDKKC